MIVRPFDVRHLDFYTEPQEIKLSSVSLYERLLKEMEINPGFTLFTDSGDVIGSGGIIMLWPGVGEAWLMASQLAGFMTVPAFIFMRKTFRSLMDTLGLRRVQAVVHNTPQACRLAALLGFAYEGTLRNYALDGSTCVMMSIIREI